MSCLEDLRFLHTDLFLNSNLLDKWTPFLFPDVFVSLDLNKHNILLCALKIKGIFFVCGSDLLLFDCC